MPKVAIIMGSKSDWEVVRPAYDFLKKYAIDCEVRVMSAHRTPELVANYAINAKINGIEVIIAAAGKSAALGGVIAAHTILPVIGIPVKSSTMDGLDSLLSTVQMPAGVPVASVAINGSKNAAILAMQILAIKYDKISDQLVQFKIEQEKAIIEDDKILSKEI